MLKQYLTIKKLKKMRYVMRACFWLVVGGSHKRLLPFYRSKIYRKFRNFNLGMRWTRKNVAQPMAVGVVLLCLVAGQAMPLVAYEAHVINVTAQIKNDMPTIEPASLEICLPGTGDPSDVTITAPFAGAELAFSVDGSVPDCDTGTRYTSPQSFGLKGSATVKARTCYDGKQSAVAEWYVETIDCGGGAAPYCGDGNLDDDEQCDDGNNVDGDGCSAMCQLEGQSEYPLCEIDGSYTEILGAGMGNQQSVEHNPQTLTVDDLENVEKIKAQVVVKALKQNATGGYEEDLPTSVLIESASGESYLISSPTVAVAGFGYFYEAEFAPADWIKATINGEGDTDYYNPRALFAYVFRKGLNYESQFKTPNVSLYWKADDRPQEHTETFNVPINTTARHIKVTVAISELANDCREIDVLASAGSVNVSQTYSQSNAGDEAHVATLILPNVPGDVTTVEVKVISPDDHPSSCDADGDGQFDDFGDSIYWNGVSVTTDCIPQPAAPICGNGQLEAGEQCDDGNDFDGDGCSTLCQIETPFCGNNIREDNEECDGSDGVTAGYYCTDLCLLEQTGGLGCMKINEVYYDVDAAHGSEDDEWIELYNACDYAINLKDWYLKDNYSTEVINQNYPIDAGSFVVIASNADVWNTYWTNIPNNAFKIALGGQKMFNGLSNTGDMVKLYDSNDNEIDAVSWGTNTDGLDPAVAGVAQGHSIARKPAGYDTDTASDWVDTHSASDPIGPNPGTNPHDSQGVLILKQEENE